MRAAMLYRIARFRGRLVSGMRLADGAQRVG
jgi:hypothetical protein